jgi:hypothetical protein
MAMLASVLREVACTLCLSVMIIRFDSGCPEDLLYNSLLC